MVIRTILKSIRQYKKESFLSPFFMIIEVIMEVLIPFFMSYLIDKGIAVGNMGYIVRMGSFLIALALLIFCWGH